MNVSSLHFRDEPLLLIASADRQGEESLGSKVFLGECFSLDVVENGEVVCALKGLII
jgi:hypothetical protein